MIIVCYFPLSFYLTGSRPPDGLDANSDHILNSCLLMFSFICDQVGKEQRYIELWEKG